MNQEIGIIKVGDVFRSGTGEIMKIVSIDVLSNKFTAQMHRMDTEEPTGYHLHGDYRKLPEFLARTKSTRYALKNLAAT